MYFIASCEWDIDAKAQTLRDVCDGYVFYGFISWENAENVVLQDLFVKCALTV